jgi:uncharacterized coiled-coil protein SlyX
MAEQRKVYRVGNSQVVAVPAAIRKHLRLKVGALVYWHLTGPREAVLTPHEQRPGGRPPGAALGPALLAADREVDRLRKKLQERPLRVLNQGVAQGWMQAMRSEEHVAGLVERVLDRLGLLPLPERPPPGPRKP